MRIFALFHFDTFHGVMPLQNVRFYSAAKQQLALPPNTDRIFFYCDRAVYEQARALWDEQQRAASHIYWYAREKDCKTLQEIADIWQWLHEGQATRHSLLVCVGGGTTTDLGGFAAATFKRGIPYINLPTTLLAMVDASTGGKTGFDFAGIKNEIGAFYPPYATWIDPNWLHTLPREEVLSGYAEMIKHALIANEQEYYRLLSTDPLADIADKIRISVAIKEQVVEVDPTEKGLRKVLNFGHTIGHAIEALSAEPLPDGKPSHPLRHGYAVMQGMVAELYLSVVRKGLDKTVLQQMSQMLLMHYGKPVCRCQDYDRLIQRMRQDKKNIHSGEITFTLLPRLGGLQADGNHLNKDGVAINEVVDEPLIREALDYLFSL